MAPPEPEFYLALGRRADDRRVAKSTGSGLGLALAREVIRLHGGEIEAESTLDEGSCFTLTLPTGGAEAA